MARNKYPEVTVEKILEVSQRLFMEKGYDNTTIQDIVNELGFTKPSVSIAMRNLRESGYINMDQITGFITLTEAGEGVAKKMYERHTVLSDLLIRLGVSKETAQEDACRIEHVISAESFDALKKHALDKK